MARFFMAGTNLDGGRAYIRGRDAEHVRVLRLRPGDEITADVKFRPSTLRYGEETDSYISKGIYLIGSVRDKTLARTGVWSRSWLYWPKTVAQSLKTSAQAAFPADVLPFAQALMLGDKSALYAQDLDIPLSTTGIMHTVAVSGLHLAFLLGFPANEIVLPVLLMQKLPVLFQPFQQEPVLRFLRYLRYSCPFLCFLLSANAKAV